MSSEKYTECGVNVSEGNMVVQKIKGLVTSTWNKNVKSRFGDFAGIYQVDGSLLVSSTDGVGTKTIMVLDILGPELGYTFLGQDIVNHCVNDILVKGAVPLFFLDYIASSKLNSEHVRLFIEGVSAACRDSGCALLGGETAEMPDVYQPGHTDIVGTIVGVVQPERLIDGPRNISVGNAIIGLRSSGPHTNGYSLIRKVLSKESQCVDDVSPHRCYLADVKAVWKAGIPILGLVHITGGGWWDNIKRVLPGNTAVSIEFPDRFVCETFRKVRNETGMSNDELLQVFNMGFGMLFFVRKEHANKLIKIFELDYAYHLGHVIEGEEATITIT